jgi:uncharacterized protein YegL
MRVVKIILTVFAMASIIVTLVKAPLQAADKPQDIMLVLDNSGSMKQNDPQFLTKQVVRDFLGQLPANARVGIVIFDEKVNLAVPLTPLSTARDKVLASLALVNYRGKLTDSPGGVERALYELKMRGRQDAAKVIIFLTDGIVDTGDKARDRERTRWLREDLAAECKQDGIRIFGIAFTDQADFQLIQALGQKTEGGYFRALKPEEIGGIFKKIEASLQKPPVTPKVATARPEVKIQVVRPQVVPVAREKESQTWLIVVVAGLVALGLVAVTVAVGKGRKEPVKVPSRPVTVPPASLYDIRAVTGKHEYPLTGAVVNIGRAATNDVVINKPTVSSRHATIEYRDNSFQLVDQRSSNGTFLNGEKITAATRLRHGDRIKIDEYEFTFILAELADETKTQLRGASAGAGVQPEGAGTPGAQSDSGAEPTKLKDMCPMHPAWKATEVCPICKTAYCQNCMVEKDGQRICQRCAG